MKRIKILTIFFIITTFFIILNNDTNIKVINAQINNINEVSNKYYNNQLLNQDRKITNFTTFDVKIYALNHTFTLNNLNFTTRNYPNNFSILMSNIFFDNLNVSATLIYYDDIKIVYFDFKFLTDIYWNITLDFLGDFYVLQITSAQLIQEEESSSRIIYRELLNMENIGSQFHIFHYFPILSIMKTAFIILPSDSEEDFDNLVNNKTLLEAFEIQFKGMFLQVTDGNGMIVYCPNIYEITSHAARSFNCYVLYGNKIFYTIGEIYIFLYWKLQSEYFNQYHGAVPDLSYWQRINGEIFEPETTIHIRNHGDIIRQFLFCRKFLKNEDSFYVNQSISESLEYLQDDSVFQTFMNGKFWCHDIHLGELNKEWILNAHTGSLLTLILAKNEGFNINQMLLDEAMNLLLEHFWDFDMGFNRISYAIWKNGVYQSFTSKSDNYELLISIDFLIMFKFLPNEQKEIISQYLKYMYARYTKLDDSYIQTLQNHRILFDLTIFFEENYFLSYFRKSYWIERYLQEDNNLFNNNNYSSYSVFGTEDYFVTSNIEQIAINKLNISLLNIKKINYYNITSLESLTFIHESFDQLLNMNLTKDICLILYFDDGITNNERINKYNLVYLMILGQIIIISSIIGFSYYKKKINIENKAIQYGEKIYQKIKERKFLISIFNLTLFIALMALPIFLNLEQYTYSLGTVFSIFIRRSISFLNIVRIFLILSLSLIILFLLIQLCKSIITNNKVLEKSFKINDFKSIINIFRLILIPLFSFVMASIWGLILDQTFSQNNLAYIILYIVQLIALNLILCVSKILPYKEEDIFSFKRGKIFTKTIYICSTFLFFIIIILLFFLAMKLAVANLAINQIIYFIFLLLISTFILLIMIDYILRRMQMKLDLSLFNAISLMILIFPTFYVDMLTIIDISIASFYSNVGIWIKLLLLLFFFGFMLNTPIRSYNNKVFKMYFIRKYAYFIFIGLTLFSITILFTMLPYIYNISNILFLFLYFIVYCFVLLSSKNLIISNFINTNNNIEPVIKIFDGISKEN